LKKDLHETIWEGTDWIDLAYDSVTYGAVINMVMYLQVP
jgi:hypothetical protein